MTKRVLKNSLKANPFFRLVLSKYNYHKANKSYRKYDDYTAIVNLYEKTTGNKLDLSNPRRIAEKLQWLKLFYRNDKMPIVSDKYEIREYLINLGYGYLLNDLYAVYSSVDEINLNELPNQFALKVTNGCGFNLIVRDKDKINWFIWKKIFRVWMKTNISYFGREWNYEKMTPRIIAEKYLEDDTGDLRDYKTFCFNGKAAFMQIDDSRYTERHQIYIRPNGERVNMHRNYKCIENFEFEEIHKRIFQLAEELSKPFPHVRVDFYVYNGELRIGELTFFTGSGTSMYIPDSYNFEFGDCLVLPEPNYNLDLYEKINAKEK